MYTICMHSNYSNQYEVLTQGRSVREQNEASRHQPLLVKMRTQSHDTVRHQAPLKLSRHGHSQSHSGQKRAVAHQHHKEPAQLQAHPGTQQGDQLTWPPVSGLPRTSACPKNLHAGQSEHEAWLRSCMQCIQGCIGQEPACGGHQQHHAWQVALPGSCHICPQAGAAASMH